MRLLKPAWLHHDGNPIFSIDIHPDDSRVVTGGQGTDSSGRVVIWNMQPILSKEEDLTIPKLLCQLDHHSACVNCVRWSNSGKYLCSGGDDRLIIIWKLVSRYSGNVATSFQTNSAFGKTNLEQWKTLSMLRSHTGDILDLAWSPCDKYLASASVDNTVIVWDALNFPQIVTTIDGHKSLVKGVCWDPIGKYLATQSDDKTLRIWRTSDWELETCLQDPFLECGSTTHVLRLDWSPDGTYLVSAHAMNNGGPTAQIIDRNDWKTDKDFVGHRKAVVCVKFNGSIFKSGGESTNNRRVQHCCVALGSRDRSVSIWSTALKRPLVVITDLFTNSVEDVCWSTCGTLMMACSLDGSVAVAQFSWKEIGQPLSPEEQSNFFHKHYGKSVGAADNCDIIQNLEAFLARTRGQSYCTGSEDDPPTLVAQTTNKTHLDILSPPKVPSVKGPTDKQIETRTADGRRRITPKFLLPPTEEEQATAPKSEQAIFLQGKGKEDVLTADNQTAAQDWRKNMVSSLENLKGFSEESTGKAATAAEASQKKNDKGGKNENNNNTDNNSTAEVKEMGAAAKGKKVDAGKKKGKGTQDLVNGNGVATSSESGDEIKKTENSVGKVKKVPLVNGEKSPASGTPADDSGEGKTNSQQRNGAGPLPNGPLASDKDSPKAASKSKEKAQQPVKKSGESNQSTKKDGATTVVPVQNSSGATLIAVRKRNKQAADEVPKKRAKLIPAAGSTAAAATESEMPKLTQSAPSPHVGSSGLGLVLQRTAADCSPLRFDSTKGHRLPQMKIETVHQLQVNLGTGRGYSLQVTNHHKRPDGACHQLVCTHSSASFNGLIWTICTDAPVCGLSGDCHRIVVLCENSTAHVLDTKGRYAFPPLVLSSYPSKMVLSGAFLAIVTVKALIHIWNIHTKSVVIRSESLLPLLNQSETDKERSLDVARIQVATTGNPIIILNTGKSFMYSSPLTAWFLLSDPRGSVSAPVLTNSHEQVQFSRGMLLGGNGRIRNKPEPVIISHIKVKLATCTEMKNADGIRQWLIALGKTLANYGLKKELYQLCQDLLGPTHSSAMVTSNWSPTVAGLVDKRETLRQILTVLLDDLKYQDFFSEFDELLKNVTGSGEANRPGLTSSTNSASSTASS